MRIQWFIAFAAVLTLGVGTVSAIQPVTAAQEDTSIGTPGHFVQYGRDYANAGNWPMAETYAKLALELDASHAAALQLLAEARKARAPLPTPAADLAAPAQPAAAAVEEDSSIGTPGHFVKTGREYIAAGDWDLAESYARMGLNMDANHAGATHLLAEARKGKAAALRAAAAKPVPAAAKPKPQTEKRAQSCDEIYGACYASARRYSPGSAPTVDYLGQQQCMVQRNICYAQRR